MKRLAIIAALAASPAHAAMVDMTAVHPGDPEEIWMEWDLETGRVSFRKPGDYLGEKLGETCAWTVGGLDPHFECQPLSSGNSPMDEVKAAAPTFHALSLANVTKSYPLSAAWSWTSPAHLGRICAQCAVGGKTHEDTAGPALNPTPVPLPASVWMLLAAVILMTSRARRGLRALVFPVGPSRRR